MRLAIVLAACVVLLALALPGETGPAAPAAPGSWNREGAAKYLDERMDLWFVKGKTLQTGRGGAVCISCHTAVPYALARPVLRHVTHVTTPTPQEARLLQGITRRVETYGDNQLFYDVSDRKQIQSRGTEAVLNALVLASADADHDRRTPGETTRKALRRLWETQRPDGAWDWLDFGLEPFESADAAYYGATLAALAVGTAGLSTDPPADAAGMDKLRGYLKDRYAEQSLFNRVSLLLASTRWKDVLTGPEREALVAEILKAQRDDGGWSLQALGPWKWSKTPSLFRAARPPGTTDASLLARSDGYATGLIVYTLRKSGLPRDHPTVRRGVQWLVANQQGVPVGQRTYPAWRSYSLNVDREHGGERGEAWPRLFMSDAATAFAVLALAAAD